MAGLFKYFKRQGKPTNSDFTELKEANKAVAKVLARVLDSTSEKASRGKYNSYTSVQRGEIGKYAAENGCCEAFYQMQRSTMINEC